MLQLALCGGPHVEVMILENLRDWQFFLGKGSFMKPDMQAESGLHVHVQLQKAQSQTMSLMTTTQATFLNSSICFFIPSSGRGLLLWNGSQNVFLLSSFLPLRKKKKNSP